MKRKIKYREYGTIYTECCVKCVREGTPYCNLEYLDNKCINFKSLEDLKKKL